MAVIDGGVSAPGTANVDDHNNLQVNLPTTATQAGYAQHAYIPTSTVSKVARVNEEGSIYSAEVRQIFDLDFNAGTTVWSTKIGTNATTMTKGLQNGFMRLNNGASTTATQGISIYSNRTISIEQGYDYRIKFQLRHANATTANKQADFGLGYYPFAAGQANAMNEFIGFRFTTTGGLIGVMETSEGGTAGVQTVNLNSNVPFSDTQAREYQIILTDLSVEFWVNQTYLGRIVKPTTMYGVFKGGSNPFIARVFNSSTASPAATFDIGNISIMKIGADDGMPHANRMAMMGKSSYYPQPDLTTGATATHLYPASGSAPAASAGSNTASAANNVAVMGGIVRNTLTGVTVTLSTNVLWTAYQNPAVPTSVGVATSAKNFMVTGISISPMVVTTALTGGGFTAFWFAAIGATATSLATTDADGTTAVAQKAPRFVPLPLCSTLAAAAALGTVATDVGDHQFVFPTALPIHAGEFISIGFRTVAVTAAVTVGTADCNIHVNGYWD